ncbi:MAG: DNA replication and repair protein RecF [Candidatus Saccharimonadales bacterium]
MAINKLQLNNFRSYNKVEFEFNPKMTAIVGANGSGKTNILEAIYTLSMTKSFRGPLATTVQTGSDWFRIEAKLDSNETVAMKWQDSQKTMLFNEDAVSPQEYLGTLPVVLFEPNHLDMVTGPPTLRRQWLDRVLSFTDRQYLRALLHYRRSLRQRNNLLRRTHINQEQLFAWDVILSEQAEYIVKRRRSLVAAVAKSIPQQYRSIAHTEDKVGLRYRTNIPAKDYREQLLALLQQRLVQDRRMGSTGVGPHRDDILLTYNGLPLAQHGSRGENRTAMLALTMCELAYMRRHARSEPILLLDDVLSELDESRQQKLLSDITDVQTIVTSTTMPSDIGEHARIQL